MALNNTFKEPARELTETAIGLFVVLLFLYVDHSVASRISAAIFAASPKADEVFASTPAFMVYNVIFLVVFLLVLDGILSLIHNVGEAVCERMANAGIDLRPKTRNVKWWWSPMPPDTSYKAYSSYRYARNVENKAYLSYEHWTERVQQGLTV